MTTTEKKRLAGWISAAVLLLWVLWLPLVSSGNIRFDSDRMLYDPDAALNQYKSEGRFGLVWLMRIMGLDAWHPLRSGILFMLFFTMAGLVICYGLYRLTEGKWKAGYALFFLLYGTCPILAYHVYFTLQIAPVGLAMLIAAAMAYADARMAARRPAAWLYALWHAASLALLVLVTSVYQALIVFYASVLTVFLFCDSQNNHRRHSWPALWLLAGRVALAVAVYWYFSGLRQKTEQYDYILYQFLWKREPVTQCLKNIGIEYGKMMLPIHSACMSVFPAAVCLLLIRMFRTKDDSPARWQSRLYAVLLLLLPAGMSIVEGNRTVPRTQFSLPLIAAFTAVFCGMAYPGKKKLLGALCCAAVVLQAGMVVRLEHTDNVRYRQDLETADKIMADLGDTGLDSKPVVFIGSLPFTEDSALLEKRDVYGCSFFEWAYTPERIGSTTYAAVRFFQAKDGKLHPGTINASLFYSAAAAAAGFPCYPEAGYIQETDGMVIVKLSD